MSELPDLRALFEQARAIGERLEALRARLRERTVEGSAGGGLVRVRATGGLEVVSVEFDPSLLSDPDPALLGDLVAAATNDALRRAQELAAEELGGALAAGPLGALLGGTERP